MTIKWIKATQPGMRYYEHATRKHGKKKDRYYSIRIKVDGKDYTYGVGWLSDGIPEEWRKDHPAGGFEDYCKDQLMLYKANIKTGANGPKSPKEKRKIAAEKDVQGQEEQRRLQQDALTFSQIFTQEYFPIAKANKTKRAWATEESLFNLWIAPTIGSLALKDISPIRLEKIKKNMADVGRAPRSIAYVLSLIRQVYNFSRRAGLYAGEWPGADQAVKIPRKDNRRQRFLTHVEADKLLAALQAKSPILYDMALLSLHSGLRAGETFKLTWADIDMDRGSIFIRDPKNVRNRHAYMTEAVKTMLTTRKAEKDSQAKLSAGKDEKKVSALVFPSRKSEQVDRISKSFSRVVDALNLNKDITDARQKVVYHSLRHTYASWLAQDGVNLFTIKELLGHSQISMTERYSHLQPGTFQSAVKVLEQGVATARQQESDRVNAEQDQQTGQTVVNFTK